MVVRGGVAVSDDPMEQAARTFRSNISRFRRAANVKRSFLGSNATTVDFHLGFSNGPIVEGFYDRDASVTNTTFVFNERGDVDEALIRLPAVPASRYSHHDTKRITMDALSRVDDKPTTDVEVNAGGGIGPDEATEWWPHVRMNPMIGSVGMGPDEAARFVRELFSAYVNVLREEGENV